MVAYKEMLLWLQSQIHASVVFTPPKKYRSSTLDRTGGWS